MRLWKKLLDEGDTQLLEYITIRYYFQAMDTKYCFPMKLRMQCRGKGRTFHAQGERKAEHLVFLFFLSRKKARKTREKTATAHLEVKAGMWPGSGGVVVCSRHLRRPVRWSLLSVLSFSSGRRVQVGSRVGTKAAPAVEDKCFLVTSAPCLITGSLLFSRFRGTCLRS